MRLSNEVVKLSSKLENTKQQLKQFENNKAKLMYQLQNLNNIISENNIIGTQFSTSIQKTEEKIEANKEISADKNQIVQNRLENLIPKKREDNVEMNRLTREIFKK